MPQPEVVVVSGVRTAVGTYGGSLKDKPPTNLAADVVREAVKRAAIQPDEVGHVVFGNVIHTDAHDMYLARVAAINGGLPIETPAFTLNRLCGSGLQAIVSAAQMIYMGDVKTAVAGGVEVMSRGQFWAQGARWGLRMGDGKLIDAMVGALTDPFDDCHMGVTAENVAARWNITRQQQDELALQSNQRAAAAIKAGYFKDQILPVENKVKGNTIVFDTDEHVKPDTTLEKLARLRPAFKSDGSVTAGNAAGVNDAAAAVVLMEASEAQRQGLKPLGRLVGYAHAGVEPKYMGIGPIPAIRKVLDRTGLTIKDMYVIELNEAFAAQALAVIKELDLPLDRTNPNGSGIALGHP
ncbi:MAG TPA: beta-ketothiolase BktB, partial [Ktedonobacteraceae bacterium]